MKCILPGFFCAFFLALISFHGEEAFSQSYAYISDNHHDTSKPTSMIDLTSALIALSSRYHVVFNFNSQLLKDKEISAMLLEATDSPLDAILSNMLGPFNLIYERVKENSYVIYSGKRELDDVINTKQENNAAAFMAFIVRGKVTDSKGQPLPGVSVRLRHSDVGTSTDLNGNYTISLPDGTGILVFTYIGFTTKEVTVKNQTVINVLLQPDTKALEEVVVVGYGTQRKADITGSVGVVNATEIKKPRNHLQFPNEPVLFICSLRLAFNKV